MVEEVDDRGTLFPFSFLFPLPFLLPLESPSTSPFPVGANEQVSIFFRPHSARNTTSVSVKVCFTRKFLTREHKSGRDTT